MATDEDRERWDRMHALLVADRLPRVQRLTGLPVASVEWVPLRPEIDDGPAGLLVRLDEGRSVIVPADERKWRQAVTLLASLGLRRRVNSDVGGRLMRALQEAAQD